MMTKKNNQSSGENFGELWIANTRAALSGYRLITDYLLKSHQQYQKSVLGINSVMSEFAKMAEKSRATTEAFADIADAANTHLAGLSFQFQKLGQFHSSLGVLGKQWRDALTMHPLQIANASEKMTDICSIHFGTAFRISLAATTLLDHLKDQRIGSALSAAHESSERFSLLLSGLARSYSGLYRSFDADAQKAAEMPPLVTSWPPIQLFGSSEVACAITAVPEGPDSLQEMRKSLGDEITEGIDRGFEDELASIDIGLVTMWRGATDAFSSENSDRKRHCSVSLRELLTHVLHSLSPDNEVRRWTQDEHHFTERMKPTREARLLFICRHINNKAFVSFLKKDIAACLAFMDLFQCGTHSVEVPFSERQLRAMLLKAKMMITYLCRIAHIDKGRS